MNDLKFDIYAMTRPQGPEAIRALLREFHAEIAIIEGHLETMAKACQAELDAAAVQA